MNSLAAVQSTQMPVNAGSNSIFSSLQKFEETMKMSDYLAKSNLVPKEFQGQPANVMIAMGIAHRLSADPFQVMQNLAVIHGRPSFSSKFLIACINSAGRFSPLKFLHEQGDVQKIEYTYFIDRQPKTGSETVLNNRCRAYATEFSSGEVIEGPWVSMEMSVKEGWYSKPGSKWKTMPELMLEYRAAAFFERTRCPGVSMGMHTEEEAHDMGPAHVVYDNEPTQGDKLTPDQDYMKKALNQSKQVKETDPEPKQAAKKTKKASPEAEGQKPDVDQAQFFKMSINSCGTLSALTQCGEDIAEQKENFSEHEYVQIKQHYSNALKAMKEQALKV